MNIAKRFGERRRQARGFERQRPPARAASRWRESVPDPLQRQARSPGEAGRSEARSPGRRARPNSRPSNRSRLPRPVAAHYFLDSKKRSPESSHTSVPMNSAMKANQDAELLAVKSTAASVSLSGGRGTDSRRETGDHPAASDINLRATRPAVRPPSRSEIASNGQDGVIEPGHPDLVVTLPGCRPSPFKLLKPLFSAASFRRKRTGAAETRLPFHGFGVVNGILAAASFCDPAGPRSQRTPHLQRRILFTRLASSRGRLQLGGESGFRSRRGCAR